MSDATEVEIKAKEMGWVPQEEFKGDPEKWIPAEEFVDRGEHLLPILHATNKRLKGDVEGMKSQMSELQESLRQSRETIAALETYHDEEVKRKVKQVREDLVVKLRDASASGDHDAIAKLTEEIANLKDAAADDQSRRNDQRREPPQDYTKHPDFVAWREDNPWYGTDFARTAIANNVVFKLRQEGNRNVGRKFLNEVAEGVEAEITKLRGGESRPEPKSKVEPGGPRVNARDSGNGKTYADLPADAKAACDAFEKQLVGPGKPYKNLAEWRKKYAERHFS